MLPAIWSTRTSPAAGLFQTITGYALNQVDTNTLPAVSQYTMLESSGAVATGYPYFSGGGGTLRIDTTETDTHLAAHGCPKFPIFFQAAGPLEMRWFFANRS